MKANNSNRGAVVLSRRGSEIGLLLAALLGSVIVAAAQSEKPSDSGRPAAARPEAGQLPRRQLSGAPPGRFAPGIDRVQSVLTEEQRESFRDAMQGQREKIRELEEKLRDVRKDLLTAGLTGKFDEAAVRKSALAAATLEAEMTVLRAKAFSQMRPALSSEQLEKLKIPPTARDQDQPEPARRRPDIRRDEHGLPLKDSPAPKPDTAEPAPKPPQP